MKEQERRTMQQITELEVKMQIIQTAKDLRAAGLGGTRKSRGRLPERLDTDHLEEVSARKTSRSKVAFVIDAVLNLMQNALKRYTIKKDGCAIWSMPITEKAFIQFFGGYVPSHRQYRSDRLYARFTGKGTAEVGGKRARVLDIRDEAVVCEEVLRPGPWQTANLRVPPH